MSGGSNRLIGLTRVLRMIRLLETDPCRWSLYELALIYNVTPRTIRRDLKVIVAVGGVLDWRYDEDSRRSLLCGLTWDHTVLTPDEAREELARMPA